METVLNALQAMRKASCREIASRMEIEPRDALEMLREQEDLGTVSQLNGCWSLTGVTPPELLRKPVVTQKTQPRQRPRMESELSKILLDALEGAPPMSTEEISAKVGRHPRALNAALGALANEGRIIRHKDRKNFTWSLPGVVAAIPSAPDEIAAVAPKVDKLTVIDDMIESIQVFAADDDLIIPTAAAIAREIRRTKARLVRLEKLRVDARNMRRNEVLLRNMQG